MVAHFYIIPQTFTNETLTNESFITSLHNFISDYHKFIEYKEDNKLYIKEDIFEVNLPNGLTLAEFLYGNKVELTGKQKSIKQSLSSILNKLPKKKIELEEIKNDIINNSIENCTGIISLHKIEDLAEENQIIYDSKSWLSFRRNHLGQFFGGNEYFVTECKKYFPNLFFHEKNYKSIGKILDGFSKKIIFHLEALHDRLPIIRSEYNYLNDTELLLLFSKKANLDQDATLEGKRKKRLKFKFLNNSNVIEELICEPHLKLCCNDNEDSKHYDNRIYFHLGKINIESNKILIAHIGKHL